MATDSEILDWLQKNAYIEAGPLRSDHWSYDEFQATDGDGEGLREYCERVMTRKREILPARQQ